MTPACARLSVGIALFVAACAPRVEERHDRTSGGTSSANGDGGIVTGGSPSAGSGGGSGGAPAECVTSAECPPAGPTQPCLEATCSAGVCELAPIALGTPAPPSEQHADDCKLAMCDGAGSVVQTEDNTDTPDDGNACTADGCSGGTPIFSALASGMPCGMGFCDGASSCVGCIGPADCGAGTFCSGWTCNSGTCNPAPTAAGTPLPAQTAQDCLVEQCDGSGGAIQVPDDADVPADDGVDCTQDVCSAGMPSHPPQPSDAACSQGGNVCDGAGTCVECNDAGDCYDSALACGEASCAAHVCSAVPVSASACGAVSCFPYACGGGSVACPASCTTAAECVHGFTCQAGSCVDGAGPWTRVVPDSPFLDTSISVENLVVDRTGDIVLQGVVLGGMEFGPDTIGGANYFGWLARFAGSSGLPLWATNATYRPVRPLAVDIDGANAIVEQSASSDLGTGFPLPRITKRTPDGNMIWHMPPGFQYAHSAGLIADLNGNVYARVFPLVGIDYGGGLQAGPHLAQFDSDGVFVGAVVDSTSMPRMVGLTIGYAHYGGLASSGLVGCGPMGGSPPGVFISRHSALGTCDWFKTFDGVTAVEADRDGCGRLVIVLSATGTVDLGGGPLPPIGSGDLVVGVLDESGAHLWSKRFAGTAAVAELRAGINGHILLKHNNVDFGAGPTSGFTVLDPHGVLMGTRNIPPGELVFDVHTSGDIIIASASPDFDMGAGPLITDEGVAMVRVSP
jgi:hypothetical protein